MFCLEADVLAVDVLLRHILLSLGSLSLELQAEGSDARHLHCMPVGTEVVDSIEESLLSHLDSTLRNMCSLGCVVDDFLVADDIVAQVAELKKPWVSRRGS